MTASVNTKRTPIGCSFFVLRKFIYIYNYYDNKVKGSYELLMLFGFKLKGFNMTEQAYKEIKALLKALSDEDRAADYWYWADAEWSVSQYEYEQEKKKTLDK